MGKEEGKEGKCSAYRLGEVVRDCLSSDGDDSSVGTGIVLEIRTSRGESLENVLFLHQQRGNRSRSQTGHHGTLLLRQKKQRKKKVSTK